MLRPKSYTLTGYRQAGAIITISAVCSFHIGMRAAKMHAILYARRTHLYATMLRPKSAVFQNDRTKRAAPQMEALREQ